LNIGPMPNGEIQPEFVDRLHWMGRWLEKYGKSIYDTKGGYLRPQKWGCLTQRDGKIYVHILQPDAGTIVLPSFPYKKLDLDQLLNDRPGASYHVTLTDDGTLRIEGAPSPTADDPDVVIELKVEGMGVK
jgi:alpha-L-fucosidase